MSAPAAHFQFVGAEQGTFCLHGVEQLGQARKSTKAAATPQFQSVVSTDKALAETHTQAEEEDRHNAAHRDEDNLGWIHVCFEGQREGFLQTRMLHDAFHCLLADQRSLEEQRARYHRRPVTLVINR